MAYDAMDSPDVRLDFKTIIIGAGITGMYAAYCCGLAGLDAAIIDSQQLPGGQCSALYPEKYIYGVPGFSETRSIDFVQAMSAQCFSFKNRKFFSHKVENIKKEKDERFSIIARNQLSGDQTLLHAKYVLIATGIGKMTPRIPEEIQGVKELEKTSDFVQCYCLKLNMYKGKDVVIAGGGDSAVDFAVSIAKMARSVTLVHRRDKFTCESSKLHDIEKLIENGKIRVILNSKITKVSDEKHVRTVTFVDSDSVEATIEADYIVFCYGFSVCQNDVFGLENEGLKTQNGLIEVDIDTMETSIENCYAAGDVVKYTNKKKNIVPCFFEADRAIRMIKYKESQI